jgi:hypothetical protein
LLGTREEEESRSVNKEREENTEIAKNVAADDTWWLLNKDHRAIVTPNSERQDDEGVCQRVT